MAGIHPRHHHATGSKKKCRADDSDMRQPRKGLITQGKQQGRSDEQDRHDEMAEHIVDHRIVIVHDVELVEIQPGGKTGQRSNHQQCRTGKGKSDGNQIQTPLITPVFHCHKTGNKQVKYQ